MVNRSIRALPLGGTILSSALGFAIMTSGCGGKPETGTQVSPDLIKAQEDSARAAEEYAKEQRKK